MTELEILDRIQRKVLWLATWMVHHANVIRPNADGIKVGGHQASSASLVTLLTALYCKALRPGYAVAVKAHAAPAFYAIQYLRGRLEASALRDLRVFGGLQAYPSRRKNPGVVDISTGSMGLGAVQATFGALAAQSVRKALVDPALDRFLGDVSDDELAAIVADAGGHDLAAVLDALAEADHERERPVVILAHTIKGWGLPLAADPLNHTALLTTTQIEELRAAHGVTAGEEWAGFAPDSPEAAWIRSLPPLFSSPRPAPPPDIPEQLDEEYPEVTS